LEARDLKKLGEVVNDGERGQSWDEPTFDAGDIAKRKHDGKKSLQGH
jgi:hypothetical protein